MRCGDSCPEGRKGTPMRSEGGKKNRLARRLPGFSPLLTLGAVCDTPSPHCVQTLCWGGVQPRGVTCCTPVAEVARAVGWVSGAPANPAALSVADPSGGALPFTKRGHHRRAGGRSFRTRGPCGTNGDTRRDSAGGRRGGAPSLWSGGRPKGHCSDVWRSSTGSSATQRTGERRADAPHGSRGLSAVHPTRLPPRESTAGWWRRGVHVPSRAIRSKEI